ncbi:MAG: phage capsid protein [Cetobacterium sp.]|uniref:phage capsid protein n=1 Tax=Cetobacterium sp. TaxID=2071632 RepID=UPI003EE48221
MDGRFDLTVTQKEFYSQQVQDNYEATPFFFKNYVSYKQEGVKGARIQFEIMAALVGGKVGAAGTSSQNSSGGEIEVVWVYPEEYIAEYFYRQLEFDQSGEYLKPKYAQRVVDAVKILEDISISALFNDDDNFKDKDDSTKSRIIDGSAAPLTFEKFIEAKTLHNKYSVNAMGEKIYAITDYVGDNTLMKLEQFSSNDYMGNQAHARGTMHGLNHLGMEFVIVPNLSAKLYGGYKHVKPGEIIIMTGDALCHGSNSGIESVVTRAHQRQGAWHTYCLANFDSKVLNSNGLTKLKFKVEDSIKNLLTLSDAEIEETKAAPAPKPKAK